MPKVSVIIPCYNLGQYLNEAVDSVLSQTFQDFEIVIVNDGSSDEFTNKLLAYYDKPKTTVLTIENQGLPSARNNGIRISSGEYISCLDADDKYHPKFLEKAITVLDTDVDHKLGFVTTWVEDFGAKNDIWETYDYSPWKEAVSNGIHVASIFRKKCWDDVGGYNPNMDKGYEDWDFWISIISMGYRWTSIKEPLFFYRVRPNSMINESDKKRLSLYRQIIINNSDFYIRNCEEILVKFMELLNSEQEARKKVFDNYNQLHEHYQQLEKNFQELELANNQLEKRFQELKRNNTDVEETLKLKERDMNNIEETLKLKERDMNNILNTLTWKFREKVYKIFNKLFVM